MHRSLFFVTSLADQAGRPPRDNPPGLVQDPFRCIPAPRAAYWGSI